MLSEAQVYQVARAVAHGHGEWAEVPRCVREGVLLALARPQSTTLQGSAARASSPCETMPSYSRNELHYPCNKEAYRSSPRHRRGHRNMDDERWSSGPRVSTASGSSPAAVAALWRTSQLASQAVDAPPLSSSSSTSHAPIPVPPYLTEAMIERNIDSFQDAAWVREQAVRSYAQFHNTVETLTTSMGSHLHALWHTAIPLSPEHVQRIRRRLRLRAQDSIPDGVPLPSEAEKDVLLMEELLHRLAVDVQQLREDSVQFAAFFLTEEEKLAMGANPVYLRRPTSPFSSPPTAAARREAGRRSPQRGSPPRADPRQRRSPARPPSPIPHAKERWPHLHSRARDIAITATTGPRRVASSPRRVEDERTKRFTPSSTPSWEDSTEEEEEVRLFSRRNPSASRNSSSFEDVRTPNPRETGRRHKARGHGGEYLGRIKNVREEEDGSPFYQPHSAHSYPTAPPRRMKAKEHHSKNHLTHSAEERGRKGKAGHTTTTHKGNPSTGSRPLEWDGSGTSTPLPADTEAEELDLAEDMRKQFFQRLGNEKKGQ